jgi:small subunit ribosomal protein S18
MSDRGKIRARRVTGNCSQHQRDVQVAIKTARELALLPYTQRTVNERGPGRGPGRGGPRRDDARATEGRVDGDTDVAVDDLDVDPDDEAVNGAADGTADGASVADEPDTEGELRGAEA